MLTKVLAFLSDPCPLLLHTPFISLCPTPLKVRTYLMDVYSNKYSAEICVRKYQ